MITFEKELDVQELELHRKLCWMDEIVYVMVEISYDISNYVPANFWHEAEGGTLEDWDIRVIDGMFTEKQRQFIAYNLDDIAISKAIWTHYEQNKWLDRQMGY